MIHTSPVDMTLELRTVPAPDGRTQERSPSSDTAQIPVRPTFTYFSVHRETSLSAQGCTETDPWFAIRLTLQEKSP